MMCDFLQPTTTPRLAEEGLETTSNSPAKDAIPPGSGAESGAVDARNGAIDADLCAVIEAWPDLPADIKAGVMALVRECSEVGRDGN
ncbi:MAG: hypothetical protein DWQ34_13235 [Planctomycetota bacterium]|nr:MAG: hypothetical protein DWQ34_13235 [Planctomycetota bacterium]